ncbi:ribosomal protein S6 kinase delta-1 isoform X2 [Periplaneta americana]
MAPPKDNWIRRFIVSDPRKHKKGFTVYKVTSIVFPKASPEAVTRVVVWKRYNDFKKLHQELKIKHQNLYLQDKFPAFAKAKFFGRFEDDVIEERRKCAVSLLEFIGDHPPLFTSNVFVKFFESGYTVEGEDSNEPSSFMPTLSHASAAQISKVLEPNVVHAEHTTTKISNPSHEGSMGPKSGLEVDGPMLKLGGTWQFPQQADSISLSSQSSDEGTIFTDTDSTSVLSGSGVSSPLQISDMQFFDPLRQSPTKQASSSNQAVCDCKSSPTQVNNSWLLSLSTDLGNSAPDLAVNQVATQQSVANIISEEKRTITVESTHSVASLEQAQHCLMKLPMTPTSHTDYSIEANPALSLMQEPSSYIVRAANHVSQAQLHEAKGEYHIAFAFYKTGIACLLNGVQDDLDNKRKQIVREKTAQYLLQAEKIYSQHLASQSADLSVWNPRESIHLQRPLSDLQFFKVLGVIGTAMLVLNTQEDCCYVMKVLHKSPCPVYELKTSIVPQNIPYMVKLHHYFDTESAVFLVLQHASGGKLWDHVSAYFQSLPVTPVHELTMDNVYLGKKLIAGSTSTHLPNRSDIQAKEIEDISVFEDTGSVSSQDNSYIELIRDYTSTTTKKIFGLSENLYENRSTNIKEQESSVQYSKLDDKVLQYSSRDNANFEHHECCRGIESDSSGLKLQDNDSVDHLPDNVQSFQQENNPVNSPMPDLLSSNPGLFLSWKNLETLDTGNLVENAQKLLISVNKTLHNSESIASKLTTEKISCELTWQGVISGTNSAAETCKSEVMKNMNTNRPEDTKLILRCKSEEVPLTVNSKRRERRLSAGRRHSLTAHARTSLERRYSSDDIFDGHGRGLSGSLDRMQQFSRLQAMIDRPKPLLPEANIRMWAAELVVAIDALHQWGIICRDLQPDNILLGEKGHLLLTYMCQWVDVDSLVSIEAIERLYAAPEVNGIFQLSTAVDWWSFGALIFELLTGKSLLSCHPGGIHSHTILNIPEYISEEAKSLLKELLHYNPQERLGSGVNGVQELKSHPFFSGIDWNSVAAASNTL